MAKARIKKKRQKNKLNNINNQIEQLNKELGISSKPKKKGRKGKKNNFNNGNNSINNQILAAQAELQEKKRELKKRQLTDKRNQLLKKHDNFNDFTEQAQQDLNTEYLDEYNNAELYTKMKEYYELVDQGIIKEISVFDKYEVVPYLEHLLSWEELDRLTDEAEQKAEELTEKYKERERKFMATMEKRQKTLSSDLDF